MKTSDKLKEISARLRPLLDQQHGCLQTEIIPALAKKGIVLKSYRELSKAERKRANDYFNENVFPILTPQAVDPGHPFPYISNLSLNLGVAVGPSKMKRGLRPSVGLSGVRFARVKLPASLPRLVPVDEKGTKFTFLGSLIEANTDMLFPKLRLSDCHLFRVTRDADFEIKEDEASDLLHTMQEH